MRRDQEVGVLRNDPHHHDRAHEARDVERRASDMKRGEHAHQRGRDHQEHGSGLRPRLERDEEDQAHERHRAEQNAGKPPEARLLLRPLPRVLDAGVRRERHALPHAALDLSHGRAQIAAGETGGGRDHGAKIIALDLRLSRRRRDRSHVRQADPSRPQGNGDGPHDLRPAQAGGSREHEPHGPGARAPCDRSDIRSHDRRIRRGGWF